MDCLQNRQGVQNHIIFRAYIFTLFNANVASRGLPSEGGTDQTEEYMHLSIIKQHLDGDCNAEETQIWERFANSEDTSYTGHF